MLDHITKSARILTLVIALVIVTLIFSPFCICVAQSDTYTASFVPRKSYSYYPVKKKIIGVDIPDKKFEDKLDKNPVHLKLLRNGEPHNDSRIDEADFTITVTNNSGTAITGATSEMSSFRAFSGSYQFNVGAPENTGTNNTGKVVVTLNANAVPGLASVKKEFIFSYPSGPELKVDFLVLGPTQDYYTNGQGSNPDPFLKDLDPESVLLTLIWVHAGTKETVYVTGVTTSDIKVEIDYDGDSLGYQEASGHISVPVYPDWFPFEPIGKSTQDFKLTIPSSGSGKIRVHVRADAADGFTNDQTQLWRMGRAVSSVNDTDTNNAPFIFNFGPPR